MTAAALHEDQRSVEATPIWQRIFVTQVPLGSRNTVVTLSAQQLGQGWQSCPQLVLVGRTLCLALSAQRPLTTHTGDVVVRTRQQHGPAGRAGHPGMKVGQAYAARGERIQIGCGDLTAESSKIRETKVIDDDEQEVRCSAGRSAGDNAEQATERNRQAATNDYAPNQAGAGGSSSSQGWSGDHWPATCAASFTPS